MKKHLLTTAMLAAAFVGTNVQAQDLSNHEVYNFLNTVWTDIDGIENTQLFGSFNKVSANGKYAVGYDDVISYTTFRWNSEFAEEVEVVNPDYNKYVYLCDVSNDGLSVGGFETAADAGMYPGYMTLDNVWTALPVPEATSERAAKGLQDNMARAITPDGNYIAGQVYVVTGYGTSPFDGSQTERRALTPCLWTKNGESYELTAYTDLGAAGQSYLYNTTTGEFDVVETEVNANTFYIYDISNDGSTMVGMNTADTGGQNPIFIRDGKLYQIFDCASDATFTFNGGICNSIDANGNIYGYFMDDLGSTQYFVFTADGKLEYTVRWYVCGDANGQRYGQGTGSLSYTLDCSEDGSVIVGGGVASAGFGAVNCPVLLYADTAAGIDHLDAVKANVGISFSGHTLCVTGEYDKAEVYSLSGALVAQGGQGRAFNLGNKAAGTYVVKVTTANGVKTFKVAK